ncbi:MAG: zinc metallopeptidase [Verrucomicrobia bacterium]|nr:zinc metallopeptidase [Verrucomicrobiota bacterium]
MIFDPMYLLLAVLPGLILGGLATLVTKSTFSKYSRVRAASGLTGAQAAYRMLKSQGIDYVDIEMVQGFLSDHYDPRTRTLRLSPGVYQSDSLSAVGVACHEAGHALQHANAYAPLAIRSALVPVTSFGSQASYIFLMLGFIFRPFLLVGAAMFALVVLFSLVTLPVEWDASARAKRLMVSSGIVTQREQESAGQVLNAAFLTYLASAVTALLTLLYFLLRAGLLGGSDD